MSTGADARTMPVTAEYEDGHKRIFGDKPPQRGRWVYDEKLQKLVPADEYQRPAPEARNAPIMAGRFYENTAATDGTDIGSRRKHREYMRQNNLTTADDFKITWAEQAKRREAIKEGRLPSKTRRDAIGRALYEIDKP